MCVCVENCALASVRVCVCVLGGVVVRGVQSVLIHRRYELSRNKCATVTDDDDDGHRFVDD